MAKKLGIGIIGAGWPGQQHARTVRALTGATLQALAEPHAEKAQNFGETYKPAKIYPDYAELLGETKIDAVINCLPNDLHFPVTLAAFRAGKHVLCEKPPTLNSAEMRVLQEEAERRGLTYFFSRQFRFTPGNAPGARAHRPRAARQNLFRGSSLGALPRNTFRDRRLGSQKKTLEWRRAHRHRYSCT